MSRIGAPAAALAALLALPRPAELRATPRRERGRSIFGETGCASCHVPDRRIERDRRFFDLEVTGAGGRLSGRVVRIEPGKPFLVRGLYSDLLQHDLGPAFHEVQFDGSVQRFFRTAPLWGVGSTAPYGHDGADLTLDAVIRRHGGEAQSTRERYEALSEADREAVLDFLSSLVLYAPETLLLEDGEPFNPERLFNVPGRFEGWVLAPDGSRVFSRALTNVEEAYGCRLPWIVDRDRDGFPDILRLTIEPLRH